MPNHVNAARHSTYSQRVTESGIGKLAEVLWFPAIRFRLESPMSARTWMEAWYPGGRSGHEWKWGVVADYRNGNGGRDSREERCARGVIEVVAASMSSYRTATLARGEKGTHSRPTPCDRGESRLPSPAAGAPGLPTRPAASARPCFRPRARRAERCMDRGGPAPQSRRSRLAC